MSSLTLGYQEILKRELLSQYVQNLPPLLQNTKIQEEQIQKNLSRALSAFTLNNICDISIVDAAKSVVDDFDDYGIDAIYYHAPTETLYFVQAKLKASAMFSQAESLAFCQGVRKLVKQDFNGFNANVLNRKTEIEDALDSCSHIKLILAHTGLGISTHAKQAIEEFLSDNHGEERLGTQYIDFDSSSIIEGLRANKAYEKVDADLWVEKCSTVKEPKVTYFGLVQLSDLVKLHIKYDKALYEKNIRTFLGNKSEVNTSIQKTLKENPKEFMYLNNGVTALCEEIKAKGESEAQGGKRKLVLEGVSIINGAQTIASSVHFVKNNSNSDISEARVFITLIQADTDSQFGKVVTRARNHQNPVLLANFAALDDEHERFRRELAYLDIHYAYKAEAADGIYDDSHIRIDEVAQALAMFEPDPRFVVWLKNEPAQLLDRASEQYKSIFSNKTAFQIANAVRVNRYLQKRILEEVASSSSQERLTYKHGNYALAWVMAKRLDIVINGHALIDLTKLNYELSLPFDQLRQTLYDEAKKVKHSPLALFRNQTLAIDFLEKVMIKDFSIVGDPAIEAKKMVSDKKDNYPVKLFEYIYSKAPQIGNLV